MDNEPVVPIAAPIPAFDMDMLAQAILSTLDPLLPPAMVAYLDGRAITSCSREDGQLSLSTAGNPPIRITEITDQDECRIYALANDGEYHITFQPVVPDLTLSQVWKRTHT